MNKLSKITEFSAVALSLKGQKWIFAKTMPQNPHEYCLKKNFESGAEFEYIVGFMRRYGYTGTFGGHQYMYLDIDDHYYWTMGAPVNETILINRKPMPASDYDAIADRYDDLFVSEDDIKENQTVANMIAYSGQSALEIGCGTGLMYELLKPDPKDYLGIDPSASMLARFRNKFQEARTRRTSFESFHSDKHYDLIFSTFGSMSYVAPDYFGRVLDLLSPNGRYFLMFYKLDYHPVTYEKTHVEFRHFNGSFEFMDGIASDFNNYVVVEGSR